MSTNIEGISRNQVFILKELYMDGFRKKVSYDELKMVYRREFGPASRFHVELKALEKVGYVKGYKRRWFRKGNYYANSHDGNFFVARLEGCAERFQDSLLCFSDFPTP